jgi:hypothetical protein
VSGWFLYSHKLRFTQHYHGAGLLPVICVINCVNCRSGGGGRLYKKVLKVHEKSADHRRMSANIPDDPMSKEDDVFQDTFDDPIHEEVNDANTDH